MALIYRKQDVLRAPPGSVIAHGVNRQLAMGKGIAKTIRERFPHVYDAYRAESSPIPSLGEVRFIPVPDEGYVIANAYTQDYYAPTYDHDGVFADVDAVCKAVITCYRFAVDNALGDLWMPRIGCGLGGLKWEDVEPFLLTFTEVNAERAIVVCDLP